MTDRMFSSKHIWVRMDGETAALGITDYAQEKLGNIMFLNLPEVGERVQIDQQFGDVESIKTVSDLISPVEGIVVKVNETLMDEPGPLNEDPYENWLVEVKMDSIAEGLMAEKVYQSRKEDF